MALSLAGRLFVSPRELSIMLVSIAPPNRTALHRERRASADRTWTAAEVESAMTLHLLHTLLLVATLQESVPEFPAQSESTPVYVTVEPYAGVIDYSNSLKESGWLTGIYGSALSGKNKFELGYEYTELNFRDASRLRQNDVTAAYSRFIGENYLGRMGAHHTITTDALSDGGTTLFGGVKYYEGLQFDTGVDVYYTRYPDFLNAPGHSGGLGVWQVSPTVGRSFGDYESSVGSFYGSLGYNYINPSDGAPAQLRDEYHSVTGLLSNYNGSWTTTLEAWAGRQAFGVRNGGFTVYNLAEEYHGGTQLSVNYALGVAASVKGLVSYQRFREPTNPLDSSVVVLGAFFIYSF